MATSPPTNGNSNGNQLPPLPPPPEQSPRWPEGALPRRQAQAEYVAGGGNWIAESPYYRSLPTFIDDITRDFGSDAYERMMLDDQVASSVRTYVESILSDPLTVRPWIDDDKDPDYEESKQYAEFAERLLANCSPTRSVDAWLFEMTMGSVSLGNRVAEKVARLEESGQDAGRLVWDRVKVKPRNRTAFVVDGFSNLLGLLAAIPGQGNLVPGAILTPDLLAVSNLLPREKFAILAWNPQEEDPRGTSLLRTVYKLWWEKIQATAEWLKHLTQFGSPSVWGTTAPDAMEEPARDSLGNPLPGAVSISPVQQLLNELLKFRNGYALALPNGSTLQLLQSANAGDAFLKMVEHHERAIDRAILLAARTRMEAKHGSKADSETSQDITGQAVRRAKTWAADMVTRDLIRPAILYNFGPDAAKRLCPYASLAPVEHQDWSQTANALAPLVSVGFLKPSQFPAMYDKLGLPAAEEPLTDDQQQGAAPPPAPGDEDFPAGNPDEAPFASGEYQEPLHPRGYGGKWANKPGAESDPEDVRSSRAAAEQFRQQAQGAAPSLARLLHEMARAVEPYDAFHRPPQVKPYDARADRQQLDQESVGKVLARAVKRRDAAHQAQDRTLLWAGGGVEHFGKGLTPAQKQRIQDQVQADEENNRRAVQRLKVAEESLRARTPPAAQPLTARNLSRASLVFFHERGDVQQRESTKQKQEEGATAAGLLRGVPRADVLALHGARVYFLPKGWQADGLSSLPGLSAISLKSSKRQEDPENSPAGLLWSHSAAPVQIPVEQIPPDARYGGQAERKDTGTFEPAKVDQYKRLSKSLYVRQKGGSADEPLAYDIVSIKDVPRLIGIPKHLVAEFAEYEEHLHPRGYGGKWVEKPGSDAPTLHTGSLGAVLYAHLQEMSQKLQTAIRESKTRKELLERAAGLWQDPSLKVWPAMGEQRAKALANRLPQPPWGGDTKTLERLLVSLGKDFGKFAQAAVRDFAEDFQSEARSGLVDAGRQGLSQRAAELPPRLHQAWEDAWAGLGQDLRGAFHDDWGEKLQKAITRAPDLATAQQRFQELTGATLDPGSAKDVHDYADEPLSRWLDTKANEVLPGMVQEFWQALAGRKAPANWAEFADYQEPLHPRGYGGKWAPKGGDHGHEQHTEQLTWRGKAASLLRQAFSQPGKSVARVLSAAEALHAAYRQGGFKAVPKVAVAAAYRKAKVSFAKLETRYGRKAAIAMAGAYLSCYAAYAANPVLMLYLPSPTAAILGTAEALRALGKGARRLAGKKGEAVFANLDILPVELEDFLDSLPDDVEFAFGLPTPYEEGKHPRGYGGKWAEKPRTFDAIQDERLQGENRALLASLTPAESAALKGYTLTDYRHLNSPLWHGKPLAPAQVKQVGHLDAIFARQKPLEQSVRCWRGFSADEKRTKGVLAQMKKAQKAGTVVEWPGYTSTSIHPGLGRAFGTVRFEIQVRHGVYLEGFSGIRGEHEMLLPRGSRFRVLGVQKVQLTPSSKPETVIQLEQL